MLHNRLTPVYTLHSRMQSHCNDDNRVPRIVLLRSQRAVSCDVEAIIQDLKSMTGMGFAILKSAQATLSVYIQTMMSRDKFISTWSKHSTSSIFTRPRLCPLETHMSSILGTTEYQGCKMVYFEKSTPSCTGTADSSTSTASHSTASHSTASHSTVQCTPPSKTGKSEKKSHKKQPKSATKSATKSAKSAKSGSPRTSLSARAILHPKKLVFSSSPPDPPLASPSCLASIPSPHIFPAPPFYLTDYVDYFGPYGNWSTNYNKFFEEVVVPEEQAYSLYMKWAETTAPKMRCRLLEEIDRDFEELYYAVCEHADCHEYTQLPCTGCEYRLCKCNDTVVDNTWKAKLKRAVMSEDWAEAARCKFNFFSGVKNEPNVLFKTRVQMLKHSNYQTHLAQFTIEQKIERCSDFCQRLFATPGASFCTTLAQLRKGLWAPLRHSSFFLKKIFNPFALPTTRIEF